MGNGCCKGGKKIDLVSPALRQLSIMPGEKALIAELSAMNAGM